jgi:hypothetical protein
MIEGRVAPRYRVNKPATIDFGGDKYACTVRDISSTGAALEFSDLIGVIRRARQFTLLIPEDKLKLSCRVVWQRDYRMGVTFD